MISLFKHPKNDHSVCSECQVFFQPYEYEDVCLNLCPTHRAPVMEKKRRKKVVMYWAERNWEKLEERAIAETTKWKMDEQKALANVRGSLSAINACPQPNPYASFGHGELLWPL